MALSASVGKGGVNRRADVIRIQEALNISRQQHHLPLLRVDGIAGPKTIEAITVFQQSHTRMADGRVDPHGPTLLELERLVSAAFEPQVRAYVEEVLTDLKKTLTARGLKLPADVQAGLTAVEAAASKLPRGSANAAAQLPALDFKLSSLPHRKTSSGRRNV